MLFPALNTVSGFGFKILRVVWCGVVGGWCVEKFIQIDDDI